MSSSNSDLRDLPYGAWEEEESTNVTAISKDVQDSLRSKQLLPCFVVLTGAHVGETYRIERGETVLGRSIQATIRFNDDGISRRHARVVRASRSAGGQLILEDLGSANGTFVNGAPVTSHPLTEGDKVALGNATVLKFTYQDGIDETFQQQMYDAALRDGLTRAFNKKYLLDRLTTELAYAVRHKGLVSLLLLDVDHFKRINDTHGHPAGDRALVHLAQVVGDALRTEDVFGRYGGEEFGVICRGIPREHARLLGERLRSMVEAAPVPGLDVTIGMTVSIGVATYPEVATSKVDALLASADEALYEAKHAGRNRVVLAAPSPAPPKKTSSEADEP